LAALVEESGADGLLGLMQSYAVEVAVAAKEDQTPEADELLLEAFADLLKNRQSPAPGEILEKARSKDATLFDRWQASMVSRRLKNYGIPIPKKSHGERRYRNVALADLLRIQSNYGIDLGISQGATPPVIAPTATHRHPNEVAAGDEV
jgi:hypothetical protein